MNLETLGKFLAGDRQAIVEIARTKSAVWIGLLFVISAGFAREYDAEDLLHEPWYLLILLVASIFGSLILYCFLSFLSLRQNPLAQAEGKPGNSLTRFNANYLTFLTLFWMTAPVAWIYAIPVERILHHQEAIYLNLIFLLIVSIWRVLLISTVISVFFRCPVASAFVVVMLFGVCVTLFLLITLHVPPIDVMSGVKIPDRLGIRVMMERMTIYVMLLALFSIPLWAMSVIFVHARRLIARFQSPIQDRTISREVWRSSFISLLVWIPILPFTQQEQLNRHRVESLMRDGLIAEALGEMSKHTLGDYPPHWDPPHEFHRAPNLFIYPKYKAEYPLLFSIAIATLEPDVAPWVRKHYAQSFEDHLFYMADCESHSVTGLDNESFEKLLRLLQETSPIDFILSERRTILRVLGRERSEEDWERLRILLGL